MRDHVKYISIPALLILAICLAPAGGLAQEQPVVLWADAKALLDQHPTLLATQADLEAAKAEIRMSRQYPNPAVGGSYGIAHAMEGDESEPVWGVEVEVPIDKPGTYINETRAAKANYQAAKSQAVMTQRAVLYQVKFAFFKTALAWEKRASLGQSRDRMAQLVQVARMRVDHGEAPPTELLRLEIELEKTEADFASAKQELLTCSKNLDLWLGGGLPEGYRAKVEWEDLPELENLESVMKNAQQDHPQLAAAQNHVEASKALYKVEKNRLFPELGIGGFYEKELDAKAYGGMVTVEVPLWNWNVGGMKTAKAKLKSAKFQKTNTERQLIQSIRESHAQASLAIAKALRYRDAILPKAREVANAGERLYQIGETSVMDLIDSRRSLAENETEMHEAYLDGWQAYFNLLTLIGDTDAKS